MSTPPPPTASVPPTTADLLRAIGTALVGSAVVALVIATAARALGASDDFGPLQPATYLPFVVVGVVVGSVVWFTVVRRAADPRRVLSVLVPAVIAVTLVPDLLLGISGTREGVSWGAVVALMLMHVAIAAVSVPLLQRAVPAGR